MEQQQLDQIEEAKKISNTTKRAISEPLEQMLFEPINVLDHGFIRVIDYMGNDSSIVQAARVSYGAGTKQVNDDQSLINYLMRNDHTSPFEMCEIKLHVKLPIFVARQWIRHRTASVNEYSSRYSILKNEFYLPKLENICEQSQNNKQGRGNAIQEEFASRILEILKSDSIRAFNNYQLMLNVDIDNNPIDVSRPGVARELARIELPLNTYTEWYWKIDLHNLLHFLKLRSSDHAQFEIREYANVLLDILQKWVPATYNAFMKYKINSKTMSNTAVEVIRKLLKNEPVTFTESGLSKGEWNTLMTDLDLKEKLV